MKKKKIWNTPAAKAVGRTKEEDIRFVLIEIAKGRHPAIKQIDKLFEILGTQLDKIDQITSPKVQLELLAWFLAQMAFWLKWMKMMNFLTCMQMSAFFIDIARDFEDKKWIMDLVHDLAVRHTGEDGRAAVFLSLTEF